MITGVCGTVGKELLRQLIAEGVSEVVGFDNNESELFFLGETYRKHAAVELYIGDLRDRDELARRMRNIDVVFHTAALKHVLLSEQSPRDVVQTNILGTQNVIDAAIASGVERFLFTSSDKAVNPTNVMGTSKLMAERLVTAANVRRDADGPIFASTRFGNVLGSRGSVIPLFRRQIAVGGPVTLTDRTMTRFIMTLRGAISLVRGSAFLAHGGEVFVTKMPSVNIADLAEIMIDELAPCYGFRPGDVPIEIVGIRPGEKLYEELVNEEEIRRTMEVADFFVVLPAFRSIYDAIEGLYSGAKQIGIDAPVRSDRVEQLSKEGLFEFLMKNDLLKEID